MVVMVVRLWRKKEAEGGSGFDVEDSHRLVLPAAVEEGTHVFIGADPLEAGQGPLQGAQSTRRHAIPVCEGLEKSMSYGSSELYGHSAIEDALGQGPA